MRNKRLLLVSLLLTIALVLGACATPTAPAAEEAPKVEEPEVAPEVEAEEPMEKTKIAFIYIGQPGDLGWTYEHERGRLMLEDALGDKVETITIPDVEWNPVMLEGLSIGPRDVTEGKVIREIVIKIQYPI